MSKVKNIYAPLKNFVDYAVTNWDKANQQSVKMAAEVSASASTNS